MPLVLGFAGLLAMVLLLDHALSGASYADILHGKSGDAFKASVVAHNTPSSLSTPGGGAPSGIAGVANAIAPGKAGNFSALVRGTGISYAGPDQGVDFTGKGTIIAPVDIKIVKIDRNSGWPGGHLIVGQVLNSSISKRLGNGYGRFIYFAEALDPITGLKTGDIVRAGQPVASLDSSYPGTEIGWAQNAAGSAFGSVHDGKAGGPSPVNGLSFASFVQSITGLDLTHHQRHPVSG